jgi:hypothetical protein
MEICEKIFPKKICGDGREVWRHWSPAYIERYSMRKLRF